MAPDAGQRYKVLSRLGEGTMGHVSLVADAVTGERLAMKVISRTLGLRADAVLQFQQEFRAMTQLRHPNCCAVFDYGVLEDGDPFFTMEVVPGQGLDELLPLPPARFVEVFRQLLLGLGDLHRRGFVHRDLKAANVRVRPDGVVKLMDFGLIDRTGRTGAPISGTPAYMAPEVIRRGAVDQRADLYSIGVLAFEALTGRLPFATEDVRELLRAHLVDAPPRPTRWAPSLAPALERLVMRLLAKEPAERHQTAYEVLEALGCEVPPGIGGTLLVAPQVGREVAAEALADRLGAIAEGRPGGALLVHGPAGIGKSRLVQEFGYAVQLASLPWIQVRFEPNGGMPYGPFVTALTGLLPVMQARIPDALARQAPVLAKLVPMPDVATAPDIEPPGKEKSRLQATVAELLMALAAAQPFGLAIEDWQWADRLSQELLGALIRATREAPALLVLTSRDGAPGTSWGELVERLPLDPLPAPEVAAMVRAMLGAPEVPASFLAQLAELSAGNPRYVERLLAHLVEHDVLRRPEGRWAMDVDLRAEGIPRNMQGLLEPRLAALGAEARLVVTASAVMGQDLGLDVLQRATGLPDAALFEALDTLLGHQILAEAAEGGYRFAEDQVRELVVDRLAPDERRRWHTAVGRAMEGHGAATGPAQMSAKRLLAIADHFVQGDDPGRTIPYALEAGKRSARLFANAEAERYLATGLALVKELVDPSAAPLRLEFQLHLANVLRLTGRHDLAKDHYREAVQVAELLGEVALAGHLQTSLAKSLQALDELEEALAACARALAVAEAAEDPAGAARSLLTSCRLLYFMGRPADALLHTQRGLALAREAGNQLLVAEALGFHGYLLAATRPDRALEGIAAMEEAIALLEEIGDRLGLLNALDLLGNARMAMGEYLQARACFERATALCEQLGHRTDHALALLNVALVAIELGDFQAARDAGREVRFRTDSGGYAAGFACAIEAVAAAHLGALGDAIALAEDALARALALQNRYMELHVRELQIEVLLLAGQLEAAREAAELLERERGERSADEREGRVATLLADVQVRLGTPIAGRANAERALAVALAARNRAGELRALRSLAYAELLAGRHEVAAETAERGLAIATRLRCAYAEAELLGWLGELALGRGDGTAAARFEAQAALAGRMKTPALEAHARFGLAAAAPAAAGAQALVARAQALLADAAATLEEARRPAFFATREVRRVLEGDHAGHGTPRHQAAGGAGALGLQGLWRMP